MTVVGAAPGLFPEPEHDTPVEEHSTSGERRRARQLAAIRAGQHPLSVALRAPLPLHPDARRDGDRDDPTVPRCGGCAHRHIRNTGTARSFPKCLGDGQEREASGWTWTEYPRATSGPGTDVATWWPACVSYVARATGSVGLLV